MCLKYSQKRYSKLCGCILRASNQNLVPGIYIMCACTEPCSTRDDLVLAGCSKSETPAPESPASTASANDTAPVGQLGNAVAPNHYRLELSIDPSQERFSGTVEIDITVNEPSDRIWLHGKDLDVTQVYLLDAHEQRIDASYAQELDSGVALITLRSPVDAGPATLHLAYSAAFNTNTNALFKVDRDGHSYAVTQFEPIAARSVFPGFDEPGFKVPFDLAVVARADDVVITTTPESSVEALSDGLIRHVFETTRPMPTYLLAFAVGPYDLVDYGMIPPNSIRDREVHLRGIAAKGLGERMDYALKNTDGLLSELEEYFGTPYPYKKLDLIAMPESFGGAMENIGAITYDEYLLLMDEDSPLNQRRAYTVVHAHEMAHMWFGNLVTRVRSVPCRTTRWQRQDKFASRLIITTKSPAHSMALPTRKVVACWQCWSAMWARIVFRPEFNCTWNVTRTAPQRLKNLLHQ